MLSTTFRCGTLYLEGQPPLEADDTANGNGFLAIKGENTCFQKKLALALLVPSLVARKRYVKQLKQDKAAAYRSIN